MIQYRRAAERGHAEHGWLDSWHSFSFADYYDPAHMGFGPLRVINEDRVQPGMGFGTHGHRDMEIVSYVLDGELSHQDNLGNGSIIKPGDVQRMSAGRGVMHSEFNPSDKTPVHFLQSWIEPRARGLSPSYEQRRVEPSGRRGRFALIASPDGRDGSVTIHQDASVYAADVTGDERAEHAIAAGRRGYVHVARGRVQVGEGGSEGRLAAGDAAKVEGPARIALSHGEAAEVIVFDLP
jgi:redox-sensitive bicupin YhaK (pirin superfamily)